MSSQLERTLRVVLWRRFRATNRTHRLRAKWLKNSLGRFQVLQDTLIEARSRGTRANRQQQCLGAAGSIALQKLHHTRCQVGSRQSGHIGISEVPQLTHASSIGLVAVLRPCRRLGKPHSTTEHDDQARQTHSSTNVYHADMHRSIQRGK